MTNPIEQAGDLASQDTTDQAHVAELDAELAALDCAYTALDDGKTEPAEIVRQQDSIEEKRGRIRRQRDIYQTRIKARIQPLYEVYKAANRDHEQAERDVLNTRQKQAARLWDDNKPQHEHLRDVLLAHAWLTDSSTRQFSKLIAELFESDGFDRDAMVQAAQRLNVYRDPVAYPQALRDASAVLDRELGNGWDSYNPPRFGESVEPDSVADTEQDLPAGLIFEPRRQPGDAIGVPVESPAEPVIGGTEWSTPDGRHPLAQREGLTNG